MKSLKVAVLILCFYSSAYAQLHKEWDFTLEGNATHPLSYGTRYNPSLKTFPTQDGDFITVSLKRNVVSDTYTTIFVYRFTPSGEVVWEYEYASPYKIEEDIHDVVMDIHGNINIAAESTIKYTGGFEPQASSNALILKISPQGVLLWSYESQPPPPNWYAHQFCKSIDTDQNGNLYCALNLFDISGSSILIQKRNSLGDVIWENTLPYSYTLHTQIIDSILMVITPGTESKIYHFNLLDGQMKFNRNILRTYPYEPSFDKKGNWYNLYPTQKYKIEKRNIFGDTLWSFQVPTNLPPNVYADEIQDLFLNDDGSLIVTGRHYGAHYGDTSLYSNCDVLTIKLDQDGQALWSTRYQFNDLPSCQTGTKVVSNRNQFTFVGGYQSVRNGSNPYASYDLLILAYNPSGLLVDSIYYDGPGGKEDKGVNLMLSENALYLLGWTEQSNSLFDQTVVKYTYDYHVKTEEEQKTNFRIFPNPVNQEFQIYYSGDAPINTHAILFDLQGDKVVSKDINANVTEISVAQLPAGIYILCVHTANSWFNSKVVIQH